MKSLKLNVNNWIWNWLSSIEINGTKVCYFCFFFAFACNAKNFAKECLVFFFLLAFAYNAKSFEIASAVVFIFALLFSFPLPSRRCFDNELANIFYQCYLMEALDKNRTYFNARTGKCYCRCSLYCKFLCVQA